MKLSPMKKSTLWSLATEFDKHLKSVKKENPLGQGLVWYPWDSLAAMDFLDKFLGGDVEELQRMMGGDPVLDIGCGDGDVGYFLESLGAQVDAVDYAPTNYNALFGVRKLKEIFDSKVRIHAVDLDTRPVLPGATYGVAIMLGILYHLKNPFLVLETLARHARYIFLSTRIASMTPDRKLSFASLPMAYLVDEDELNKDATNFWIFSEEALKRLLRRSGWNVLQYVAAGGPAREADPVSSKGDVRAYLLAESRVAALTSQLRLEKGWHYIENDAWRWTAKRFSAELHLSAALAPATVRFLFHLPQEAVARRPDVVLSATVNGKPLAATAFSTPGEHEYAGVVPSLDAGKVRIDFELDHALAPSPEDERELGVLVDFSGVPPLQLV